MQFGEGKPTPYLVLGELLYEIHKRTDDPLLPTDGALFTVRNCDWNQIRRILFANLDANDNKLFNLSNVLMDDGFQKWSTMA